jgi:(aminoalkyl)phosphonate N-acetyltransferase
MTYLIRVAEEKDIPAVYNFVCLLEETGFNYNDFEIICCRNITNRDYYYLVAQSAAGAVIGFISCHTQSLLHHCGKVAEIQELFVDDKYRKLGIGIALLKALEEKLLANNCFLFEVTAQNKREQTHRFYKDNGFIQSHQKFTKQLS